MVDTLPLTLCDIEHELRAVRQRAVLLAQLRTELIRHYGQPGDAEFIELGDGRWEEPLPAVVTELSLELGVMIKGARDRRRQMESMHVDPSVGRDEGDRSARTARHFGGKRSATKSA